MTSADVFISYASKDVKVATTLCKALEARGIKCWIASRDIQPGENFQVSIVQAIRNANLLLLVFTGNSNASEEMTKELALASQQRKIVIPLRIEDVAPSDAFAYEFATRQWIDFFANWEIAVEQLTGRIKHALADPQLVGAPHPDAHPIEIAPSPQGSSIHVGKAQIAKPTLAVSNGPVLDSNAEAYAPVAKAGLLASPKARIMAAAAVVTVVILGGLGLASNAGRSTAAAVTPAEAPVMPAATPVVPIPDNTGKAFAQMAPSNMPAATATPQFAVAQISEIKPVVTTPAPVKKAAAKPAATSVDIPF